MGRLGGIIFFATRALLALWEPLALRHGIKKWAACAALAGMTFYLFLSGATIPTQRAYMMGALVIAAILFDRTAISMRSVALAAVAVLLLQPESLLGASFQMSFAAVVALVAVFEARRERYEDRAISNRWYDRLLRYFAFVALVTVIAGRWAHRCRRLVQPALTPFALGSTDVFQQFWKAVNDRVHVVLLQLLAALVLQTLHQVSEPWHLPSVLVLHAFTHQVSQCLHDVSLVEEVL